MFPSRKSYFQIKSNLCFQRTVLSEIWVRTIYKLVRGSLEIKKYFRTWNLLVILLYDFENNSRIFRLDYSKRILYKTSFVNLSMLTYVQNWKNHNFSQKRRLNNSSEHVLSVGDLVMLI